MEHPSQHSNVEFARLMYRRMINAQEQENLNIESKHLFLPDLEEPEYCFEHNGIVFICNEKLLLAKWDIGNHSFVILKNCERSEKYFKHKIEPLWLKNQQMSSL